MPGTTNSYSDSVLQIIDSTIVKLFHKFNFNKTIFSQMYSDRILQDTTLTQTMPNNQSYIFHIFKFNELMIRLYENPIDSIRYFDTIAIKGSKIKELFNLTSDIDFDSTYLGDIITYRATNEEGDPFTSCFERLNIENFKYPVNLEFHFSNNKLKAVILDYTNKSEWAPGTFDK